MHLRNFENTIMKYSIHVLFLFIVLVSCQSSDETQDTTVDPENNSLFYKGMDLSFQSELENYNLNYKDSSGNPIDLLDFVSSQGVNLIRLRLWHTPENGQNSLHDVKTYALRAKNKNMDWLLDMHYSDFWADPATQTPPSAWAGMTFLEVRDAVYNYTRSVVQELNNANALPKIIQIGNETDSGFLWDYGRVWDDFSDNWENYSILVNEAIRAIREVDTNGNIKIMLHHSSVENAIYFFDELNDFNLNFDIIGLSYYPQFQTRNLNLIQQKISELATRFNKDIMIAETAYPFTLDWNDNTTNFIGDNSQILQEFPPTPNGQKLYLDWLAQTIKNIPNEHGLGFCYWAPDWVAFSGNESTSTGGSSWENQCTFDFDHKALPIFNAFKNN